MLLLLSCCSNQTVNSIQRHLYLGPQSSYSNHCAVISHSAVNFPSAVTSHSAVISYRHASANNAAATSADITVEAAGKIVLSTIPENAPFLKQLLGVEPQPFRPCIPHLVSLSTICSYLNVSLADSRQFADSNSSHRSACGQLSMSCMHGARFACICKSDATSRANGILAVNAASQHTQSQCSCCMQC